MNSSQTAKRRQQLRDIAEGYVVRGLGRGDFDAIPYHCEVELRAPLCPGGSGVPLRGRDALRSQWWQPLPDLVERTELRDVFVNDSLTAVAVEFLCHIREPKCTLRVIDRFEIDESGRIVAQENFFDPRDVTNPGWKQ